MNRTNLSQVCLLKLCHSNVKKNSPTSSLFSNLLSESRYQCAHSVALSASTILLHTSAGPLAAEDGTCPPDSCILQILSVIVLATQVLNGLDGATRVTSQSHLGGNLRGLVGICKETNTTKPNSYK